MSVPHLVPIHPADVEIFHRLAENLGLVSLHDKSGNH